MTFKDKPKRFGSKAPVRDARPKPGPKTADVKPAKAAAPRAVAVETDSDARAERISKVMARAGVASRRDIERMIMEGRVKLNGVILDSPVVNVTLVDKIEVDGVPIRGIERTRLWLYHKPAGLVTTNSDPEGRATVFDNLPDELPRVMSIGRLDINTEGLLLLTNDGGLARVLELPATGWLRRYRVRAHGEIDQDKLDTLKEGIAVDGVLYGSIEATLDRTQGSNVWITMALREGKNREIKNVLGVLGLEVNRLIRISYGPFQLGELPDGHVMEVRGRTLRDQLGPRLIEDAKANFDAPIYNATAAGEDEEEEAKPVREEREWRPRADKPKPGEKRERALSRLDTKKDDRRDDGERPKRAAAPAAQRRSANVWMAPGARPLGEKATAKAAKYAKDPRRESDARPAKAKSFEREDESLRVKVNRVKESDGEWIRSSEVDKDEAKGFGRKASFGDKPREERSFGDKPRGERSFGDKPRGERSFGDKPRGERRPRLDGDDRPRTVGDRPPRGDKPPYTGKPRPEGRGRPEGDKRPRPEGDKRPRAEGDRRPRAEGDERPRAKSFAGASRSEGARSERPAGAKPAGKSFGAKPGGSKSFAGKPKSDRPSGDRPGGDRPSGGPSRPGSKGKGMTRGADRRR